MSFLRRSADTNSPGPEQPEAPRDPVFTALSARDADWMRTTALRVLAENGVEATLDDDGATFSAADGNKLTLDNAAKTCFYAPRDEWLSIMERFFGKAARSSELPLIDELSREQLLAQVRTSVLPADALTIGGVDMSGYARPVADNLAVVLCVDFPEAVTYVSDADAAQLGDLDELFRAGQANTDDEPIDQIEHVAEHGVTVVDGASVFTSSKILNMPALLGRMDVADAPHGVVFAAPDRGIVVLHVIVDISSVEAIGRVALISRSLHDDAVYPVSPHTYHWYRDTVTRISEVSETGDLALRPTEDLMTVINSLAD